MSRSPPIRGPARRRSTASDEDANYRLNTLIAARSTVGLTETPLFPARSGLVDRGDGLFVKMRFGTLESVSEAAFLGGANLCAIGDGTPGGWELFQFREAELVAPDTYILRHRLRGQLGTEGAGATAWPAGSILVRLDGVPQQIELAEAQRGQARHYRIGPGGRPVDDPAYRHAVIAFDGLGLRPYAPVHLRVAEAGGDLKVTWIRRTRIGGDRWDTPEVPLGEERESYLSGSGGVRRCCARRSSAARTGSIPPGRAPRTGRTPASGSRWRRSRRPSGRALPPCGISERL